MQKTELNSLGSAVIATSTSTLQTDLLKLSFTEIDVPVSKSSIADATDVEAVFLTSKKGVEMVKTICKQKKEIRLYYSTSYGEVTKSGPICVKDVKVSNPEDIDQENYVVFLKLAPPPALKRTVWGECGSSCVFRAYDTSKAHPSDVNSFFSMGHYSIQNTPEVSQQELEEALI